MLRRYGHIGNMNFMSALGPIVTVVQHKHSTATAVSPTRLRETGWQTSLTERTLSFRAIRARSRL